MPPSNAEAHSASQRTQRKLNQGDGLRGDVYPCGMPDPLPADVTLQDIVKSMPKEVFQKNARKAWQQVLVTVTSTMLSMYLLSICPWYLLPLAWAFAGTACTGFFVIGHDCGHLSFARSHFINDIVGLVCFLPLIYPFESWRIKHNLHHQNTNLLHVDNAWQPFQKDHYLQASAVERTIMRIIKGPLWFLASTGHWIKEHFFLDSFTKEQQPKVWQGIKAVYIFAALFFPTMLFTVGFWGLIKYWFVPFIGFHFWMSTFTMVHHTLPHIPFLDAKEWNDAQARLSFTVHCEYPAWIEFFCHHINVHVPHHVSTAIPSYNLRAAHNALQTKWGKYMNSCVFSWALLKEIITQCHIYDKDENYVPFEAATVTKAETAKAS